MKPFVVIVEQIGTGGFRSFFFDMEVFAKQFARETGGTLYKMQ